MTDVLLVTCRALPDGEERDGSTHLVDALRSRGLAARWVAWDDPAVDWQAAGLVAVRSTWDYEQRRTEFLAWARAVGPRLLNGAAVFAWNTDKRYLLDLAAAGVPVVPTTVLDLDDIVLKPSIGAGGRGVVVVPGTGPWVAQPLVASVRTEGERSVFVLAGRPVSSVAKRPAAGELRVHEEYGGSTVVVPLDEDAGSLARRTVAAAEELLGVPLDYARVDLMRLADGTLAVSELEATEPGLYLEALPGNADAFADLVLAVLDR